MAQQEAAIHAPEPGPNAQYLLHLWHELATYCDNATHALEQSSLRWMLRTMNEASPAAETLRRYPLAWNIVGCVLRRIPLIPLAKALADCNFVAALKQTLIDISKPVLEPSGQHLLSKRKRTQTVPFDLQQLQAAHACLETAQAVFGTLRSLLEYLDMSEGGNSRDKTGAENIKSLFCTLPADAAPMVAPALKICGNALAHELNPDSIQEAHHWVKTISKIWDLHLQASDDSVEVATRIFVPCVIILKHVGCLSHTKGAPEHNSLKKQWRRDIQDFMHGNLILPGRETFTSQNNLQSFETALAVSQPMLDHSGPALYFLCCGLSPALGDIKLRKSQVEWLKQIFKIIEIAARRHKHQGAIIKFLLDEAIRCNAPVDLDDLGRICREFGLGEQTTDWDLVSKISRCDADVYQLSQEGADLQRQVCSRSIECETLEAEHQAISEVIGTLMSGFQTRRNLPSFLRLWFQQLCDVESRDATNTSPWYQVGKPATSTESLGSLIETELLPQQLTDIISWLEAKEPKKHPQSICVFTSLIADALQSEDFVDVVGQGLFDLVAGVKSTRGKCALKWRVASRTLSWLPAEERLEVWSSIKKKLTKILTQSPVVSSETFEAFKCCLQAWELMVPDDEHIEEAASLVDEFLNRLAAEMRAAHVENETPCIDIDARAEFEDEFAFQLYTSWCLNGTSRFNKLLFERRGSIPECIEAWISPNSPDITRVQNVWNALLHNKVNLDMAKLSENLVERLIAGLEGSQKEKGWPGVQSQVWIKMLNALPHEVVSRVQREKIMNIVNTRRASMLRRPKRVTLEGWRYLLSLATKMMRRPTFYQDMKFMDLVELGEALAKVDLESSSADGQILLEIIERYFQLASTTLRQMTLHADGHGDYFSEALEFADKGSKKTSNPLIMTLLKALQTELKRFVGDEPKSLLRRVEAGASRRCAKLVARAFEDFVSDEKLLACPDGAQDLSLLAAVGAALSAVSTPKLKLDKEQKRHIFQKSQEMMKQGDLRGWKIQAFMRKIGVSGAETDSFSRYSELECLPTKLQEPLLKELVEATSGSMQYDEKLLYLKALVEAFKDGCDTDGQILAIQYIVDQLLDENVDARDKGAEYSLATAHGDLTGLLLRKSAHAARLGRVLQTLLEKQPQVMGQWNVEVTLSTVSQACYKTADDAVVPFTWLCRLVNVTIRKHRLRLQGHQHMLMLTLEALLCRLVALGPDDLDKEQDDASPRQQTSSRGKGQDDDDASKGNDSSRSISDKQQQQHASCAQQYTRLITLICEPPTSLVARTQVHGALDSARDTARRAAGQYMYLVLMHYVRLQLREVVSWRVREALEPAVMAIFDITTAEQRACMIDGMDISGRAILRDMYKNYVKFGKWSGV
ncbi:hypothetical protein CDD81_4137 [Ophiocordyceps australis]|uniref:Nucleolar 27S pre-rRNA processing Urb2/Npa2 C-terminal domain-containing protein n=1 Tax=Ophiocordyceps australis TaxID=1399860 RepID=A0A2C5YAF8_9HYPO|nr:hypothetical protein CDD81_4137 [Ophiocordyceps australis]